MTVRRVIVHGVLLLLGAVLMVTLSARGLTPMPDLIAVVVATLALRHGWRAGVVAGLAGGWLLDLLPPGATVVGLTALLYAVGGAAAGRLHRPGPVPLVVVALATGVTAAVVDLSGVALALVRQGVVDGPGLLLTLLVTVTVGLLLGPALLRLDGRLGRGQR